MTRSPGGGAGAARVLGASAGEAGAGLDRAWPDLRLAAVAVATWLAALGCRYLSWSAGAAVAATAAVLAVVCALSRGGLGGLGLSRGGSAENGPPRVVTGGLGLAPGRLSGGPRGQEPIRWAVLAVLIGVLAGAGCTAARVALRDAEPLAGLARRQATVRVELVVTDDPHPVRGTVGRPPAYTIAADLTGLTEPVAVRVSVRILVVASDPAWRGLLPGQQVTAVGRLQPGHGDDLRAAVLQATGAPLDVGAAPWAQRAAGGLRAGLQRACASLPREPGGLLPGLVVGDTSRVEPAVADDFRATGMTHLLAVSGSNVALVVGLVLGAVRWCRAGPRLAATLSLLALVGFVILVRPSPSVLRAAAMGAIGLLGLTLGRPAAAVPGLSAVVIGLVLYDPQLAGDAGFALSVLATAGLLLIAPGWRDRLRARGVPAGLAEALAVPAAAQVACAPVIAAISGTVGLAAIPANLVAVPAVAPATVLGVTAALLSVVWTGGAEFVAWLASWPARWLVLVAGYGADAPGGTVPWLSGAAGGLLLAVLLVIAALLGRDRRIRRFVAVVSVAVLVGALPVRLAASGWPPPGWLLVVCDVGQGDAVVLPVGPGEAVVVDAGPDPAATDGCLRRLGVRQVVLLVVSHFHADHVGGIEGVFHDRSVGAVLVPGYSEPAAGHTEVLTTAANYGVPVGVAPPGAVYVLGGVRLSVVGPVTALGGTRSDPNNNSLVLRATIGGYVLLLAGDAEEDEQRSVLAAAGPGVLRADVLKLAHHGSAYQEPGFLDAADPAVVLVSVGAGNPYGHPNAAVLSRLSRGGAQVLRTDDSGDVAATVTTEGRLAVVARGRAP